MRPPCCQSVDPGQRRSFHRIPLAALVVRMKIHGAPEIVKIEVDLPPESSDASFIVGETIMNKTSAK